MKKAVLFDLDGTITDSQEGITRCVQYALQHFGIEEQNQEILRSFIGPPLWGQFQGIYGLDEAQTREAVAKFRERYQAGGMYECHLYPYVKEILHNLKEKGYLLALASSKIESSCINILKHFEIDTCFDFINGATKDGTICEKADVLKLAMGRLGLSDVKDYVLIGDTRFDALGAKAVGMDCIGVTYGFGTREELMESGTVCICDNLKEVEAYLEK